MSFALGAFDCLRFFPKLNGVKRAKPVAVKSSFCPRGKGRWGGVDDGAQAAGRSSQGTLRTNCPSAGTESFFRLAHANVRNPSSCMILPDYRCAVLGIWALVDAGFVYPVAFAVAPERGNWPWICGESLP